MDPFWGKCKQNNCCSFTLQFTPLVLFFVYFYFTPIEIGEYALGNMNHTVHSTRDIMLLNCSKSTEIRVLSVPAQRKKNQAISSIYIWTFELKTLQPTQE